MGLCFGLGLGLVFGFVFALGVSLGIGPRADLVIRHRLGFVLGVGFGLRLCFVPGSWFWSSSSFWVRTWSLWSWSWSRSSSWLSSLSWL
jgi:hypothetical protein